MDLQQGLYVLGKTRDAGTSLPSGWVSCWNLVQYHALKHYSEPALSCLTCPASGTQEGGWGHNAGDKEFQAQSAHGNGTVRHCSACKPLNLSRTLADMECMILMARPLSPALPIPQVWVTSHPASEEDTVPLQASHPDADVCHSPAEASTSATQFQEWRVLRFNEDTRQSVARVVVIKDLQSGDTSVVQRSDCMAFLYMKTLAAAGLTT